ncbi:hypothetical protein P8452_38723 [Trifolium repens]|nr:hypothetical protein P8452_38723 [Trifolium repens]
MKEISSGRNLEIYLLVSAARDCILGWLQDCYIFFRKCIQTKGKEQYAPQASDEQTNGTLNKGKGQSSQLFAPPPGFQEEI